jgi:hypothetical protein
MSKATYPLKLPLSIKKAAQRLAKEDAVSLSQWIAAAVAEKVGVIETAADFFKKRAGKASGAGLMKFLRTRTEGSARRRRHDTVSPSFFAKSAKKDGAPGNDKDLLTTSSVRDFDPEDGEIWS